MNKVFAFIVCIAALVELCAGQDLSSPSGSSQSSGAPTVIPGSIPQEFRDEMIRLHEKVESVSGRSSLLINILAAVLALGGVTSLFSWTRHEFGVLKRRDEKIADKRADQLHTLMVRGEEASQGRSEEVHRTFLAGSKDTLELVNATLTLAKEASERAARSIEARATSMLQELDQQSKDLLASVPSQDDRALVAEPSRTAILRSLAQRIEAFQTIKLMLPDAIRLTPPCMFIRGMDFHLKQQFNDAFAAWKDVAFREEAPAQLKSLAWYWIGYENNNLGWFNDACQSFEQALETATGARHLELQRIELESRFFRKDDPHQVVALLDQLLATPHEGSEEALEAIKRRIQSTIGNIYLATGNENRKLREDDEAKKNYREAQKYFLAASKSEKWALFGLAESLYWLADAGADDLLRDKIRPQAVDEEIRRIEPRTKVLARTTELICCIRVREFQHEVAHIYSQVTEALGRVEEGLTVYSQVKRRNVNKREFREDLADLMSEFEQTSIKPG
jgi:hypothetical protein